MVAWSLGFAARLGGRVYGLCPSILGIMGIIAWPRSQIEHLPPRSNWCTALPRLGLRPRLPRIPKFLGAPSEDSGRCEVWGGAFRSVQLSGTYLAP